MPARSCRSIAEAACRGRPCRSPRLGRRRLKARSQEAAFEPPCEVTSAQPMYNLAIPLFLASAGFRRKWGADGNGQPHFFLLRLRLFQTDTHTKNHKGRKRTNTWKPAARAILRGTRLIFFDIMFGIGGEIRLSCKYGSVSFGSEDFR